MSIFLTVCFFLASAAVLSASIIALVRPLPKVGLGSRKKAVQGLGVAFALFVAMVIVMPKPDSGEPEKEAAPAGTIAAVDSQIAHVKVTEATSYASIKVDLKQSWSAKDMPTQAAMVIEEVGKALKKGSPEIPPEIERINFWFTLPMVSVSGEESRAQVFNITFKADDLRGVDYGAVPTNRVLDLGDKISFGGMAGRDAAAEYCGADGHGWSPGFCRQVLSGLRG